MNDNIDDFEWIDRYLENDLSENEREEFEKRLESDDLFREEFEHQKELIDAIEEHASISDIKEEVKLVEGNVTTFKQPKKAFSLKTLFLSVSTVAAAVFVITFSFMNYQTNKLDNSSTSYTELSGRVEELKEQQQDILESFKNKEKPKYDYKFGTAIYLGDSLFLTNKHLVKKHTKITVGGYLAKLVTLDTVSDLALVHVIDSSFVMPKNVYGFSTKELELATDIYTLGFPKKGIVYKTGVLSSLTGSKGDTTQFEISTQLNAGNSGSPVFDLSGNLIGIIIGKSKTQSGAGFVIQPEVIERFILANNLDLRKKSSVRALKRTAQVKSLSASVMRVEVW